MICTDGMRSYEPVIRNEYVVSAHKKNMSLRDGGNNRVERYHGNWKERYKVMRGLENGKTSKEMLENYRTYYNFIRPHQALCGLTPAEMTGINMPGVRHLAHKAFLDSWYSELNLRYQKRLRMRRERELTNSLFGK